MDDTTRPHRLDRLASLAALLCIAGSALAIPPGSTLVTSPIPMDREATLVAAQARELAPIAELLGDLGADDLQIREAASRKIVESEACRDEVIVKALRTFALLPEQRARLVDCMRQRFFGGPHNAIGVQMQPMENGVMLTRVFPQFPASQVLMAGDAVIEIDGVNLAENAGIAERTLMMTRLILAHERSEPLRMRIIRNEEAMDLKVPLGTRRAFDDQNTVDEFTLEDAWRLRLERLGVDDGAGASPLVAAIDPRSDWLRSRRAAMRLSAPEGIVSGGEASLEPQFVAPQVAVARPAPQVRPNVVPNRAVAIDPQVERAPRRVEAPNPAFSDPAALEKMKASLATIRKELERPNLAPERREELLSEARALEGQINAMEGLRDIFKKAAEGGDGDGD